MFPLTDENPHSKPPYVNYFIIGINIIFFIYEISLPIANLKLFMFDYGILPVRYFNPALFTGFNFVTYSIIPFFSSMFLHAGRGVK